ncbi:MULTISPECIES: hypothetical protein [Pseudomonas]|jgi:hypothetical protein|uniref:hypothetical protein n=1 Tax=Pseudomonas TaxID=286 RepID=UPI0010FF7AC7|nr:hypothetical protein [Pseudomonas phenolilytica]QCT96678.1 hypothetical protein FEV13_07120 [Stutzerimonas degradans]UIP87794.1 hypothetical protein HU825_15105 [Pseudomonas phenolilytica]
MPEISAPERRKNDLVKHLENAWILGFDALRAPRSRLHCPPALSILAAVFAFENAISVEAFA